MGTQTAAAGTALPEPSFRPVRRVQLYLPLEDFGLIGDGSTAALVGRDGSVAWLCVPRFDSPPLLCEILDARKGGAFRIALDGMAESRQYYEGDSAVLQTEMRGDAGVVRVTDALVLSPGSKLTVDASASRQELLRVVTVLKGTVRLRVEFEPFGGARIESRSGGLSICCAKRPELELHLLASLLLEGAMNSYELSEGDSAWFLLCWGGHRRYRAAAPHELLNGTLEAWRGWMRSFRYDGPQKPLVRRSAITLKMLDNFANGAIVAAPTSSLPETIGGVRNWDYRYAWVRDAAFSVYALHRIGHSHEAAEFLGWVLDAVENGDRPKVLYDLDGEEAPSEREDPELEGYRGSSPVRWGNAAAQQLQHDIYGEILDCAYQWAVHHGSLDRSLWIRLCTLIEAARVNWRTPDQGIWEVRSSPRAFTYSAALCQVALDRGARLAERFGLSGDTQAWRAAADQIRDAILQQAWDPRIPSLTRCLDGGGLDASLLSLPLRRLLPTDHPKMVATTEAVSRRLGAGNGLLYRYLPEETPDGLPGYEGAFLLCSFWMVDNLAGQGRLQEAHDLYDSLCARAGPLGLLPEQIDPSTGAFLGNYPQAFSHIGLISSGVQLSRRG